MIVASAILKDGVIHTGRRHHNILLGAKPFGAIKGGLQGFVTDKGEFLDRYDAAKYAYEHGQITYHKNMLFSEDLW